MSTYDKARDIWYARRRVKGEAPERIPCKTEAEANAIEANWKAGKQDERISFAEEKDALAALAILKKFGKSLTEAAMFFVNHGEHLQNTPVSEAWAIYYKVIENRGRESTHLRATRLIGKQIQEAFGPKAMTFDMTDTAAVKYLRKLYTDPTTLDSKRRQFAAFFNWCAEQRQRFCRPIKFVDDDFPEVVRPAVGFLTAKQLQEFFDFVAPHPVYSDYLPAFILQAFTGTRREEIPRIKYEFIDFERKTIRLPAKKQGTDRVNKVDKAFVLRDLPEGFWKNFERFKGRTGNILAPHTHSENRMRKELAEKTSITVWPDNAFRHGFATNHISLSDSADKTALLLKHKDAGMLYEHYMGEIVSKEEATAYLSVTVPESEEWVTAPAGGVLVGYSPKDPRPFRKWCEGKDIRSKPHQTWVVYAKADIFRERDKEQAST